MPTMNALTHSLLKLSYLQMTTTMINLVICLVKIDSAFELISHAIYFKCRPEDFVSLLGATSECKKLPTIGKVNKCGMQVSAKPIIWKKYIHRLEAF